MEIVWTDNWVESIGILTLIIIGAYLLFYIVLWIFLLIAIKINN